MGYSSWFCLWLNDWHIRSIKAIYYSNGKRLIVVLIDFLCPSVHKSVCHAKDELWLGAKSAHSERINWPAFGQVWLLCYFYIFNKRVGEQSKSNCGEVVSDTNRLFVSIIMSVKLNMNSIWTLKAPDKNQYTDWPSVDNDYNVAFT